MKINETSKETKFKQTLFGSKNNIFTFCIGSPENPMGIAISDEENNKKLKEFKTFLLKHRLHFYEVEGKYDNIEHSFLIANINLNLCKYLFGKDMYNQESFIFGTVMYDENVYSTFYYYQQNENKKFELLDSEVKVSNANEYNNYYSKYKGYKFSIPFSIFNEGMTIISNELHNDYGWNNKYRDYLKESSLSESRTIGNIYRYNCSHLLTESQNRKRLENIKNSNISEFEKKYVEHNKYVKGIKDLLK